MDLESILNKCSTISGIKSDLKTALTDYGFSPSDTFSTYADLIRQISQTTYTTGDLELTSGNDGDIHLKTN